MALELTLQALIQLWQLLLTPRLSLLPELSFHPPALLHVTRFELTLRIGIQMQIHLPHGSFCFGFHLRPPNLLAFAQHFLLRWVHFQPLLGIAPEGLSLFR